MNSEFETTIEVSLNLKVRFSVQKAEPMTRHYPGCNAHLDDIEFSLISTEYPNKRVETPIEGWMHDAILGAMSSEEWQEMCFEQLEEEETERKISRMDDRKIAGYG